MSATSLCAGLSKFQPSYVRDMAGSYGIMLCLRMTMSIPYQCIECMTRRAWWNLERCHHRTTAEKVLKILTKRKRAKNYAAKQIQSSLNRVSRLPEGSKCASRKWDARTQRERAFW